MRAPPPYQLKDGAIGFGAVGVFALVLGFVRWEWQSFVAAAVCLALSPSFWAVHVWWRRRYDEWHPNGVDLVELHDNPPEDLDWARVHAATLWTLSDDSAAEASSLVDALKGGEECPQHSAPEVKTAWTDMVEIETAASSQLTALVLGGRPEWWWVDDITARMQSNRSWRSHWPDRATVVDSAVSLLERAAGEGGILTRPTAGQPGDSGPSAQS